MPARPTGGKDGKDRHEFLVQLTDKKSKVTHPLWTCFQEEIMDENLLQEHQVEDGFVISSYIRRMPRSGTLELLLSEDLIPDAMGGYYAPDLNDPSRHTSAKVPTLAQQFQTIKELSEIKDKKGELIYNSLLYKIDPIVIESIRPSRDKVMGRILITIKWREVLYAKAETRVINTKREDPTTGTRLEFNVDVQGVSAVAPKTVNVTSPPNVIKQTDLVKNPNQVSYNASNQLVRTTQYGYIERYGGTANQF